MCKLDLEQYLWNNHKKRIDKTYYMAYSMLINNIIRHIILYGDIVNPLN